ncbi:MAG: polymer-forming cytoskeletal protein [Alphaproteobacteria bacterium]|nr:polymer-forming cytoskeletal protein [Alphaproteobacteria bacterium]
MFHRVKSETATESTEQTSQVEEQETLDIEEAAAEAEVDTQESEEASDTSETQTQEEETETMTKQSEDTPTAKSAPAEVPASYKKPTQSAVRPGGYPGAYPGVAYGAQASSAAASSQDEHSDRTLTIGAGITMSGEIESCDNLIVEGTVEAALKGARNLDIAESGTFYGTVDIEDAVIAGRFEGELTVNGRLVIRSGGVITGSIAYGELEVEAGAIIDGRLTPVAAMQQAQQGPAKQKAKPTAPKAKVSSADDKAEAANSEGALFAAQG